LIAAALAYAVTLGLGIAQLLGVDSPLLEYERGFIQLTSEGFARANGLYGTQIDFGCLSFFVFTVAFYINRRRGSWFAKITMALALLGALASMSRVAAAAFGVLFVVEFLFRGSFRDRLKHLVALSLVAAALYPLSEIIGATSTLMSEDPYAQDSTQGHLAYYVTLPRLLIQLYPIVGTGPGSQNGPGGPDGKIATDCLWLGFLVDFGAVTGAILVLFRVILLAYLLYRAYRFRSGLTVRITTVLTLMFLLASFVNSAFAYPVTVSIFYIIAGIFLYEDQVNQVRTACQFA
jgi:hypothetical protein